MWHASGVGCGVWHTPLWFILEGPAPSFLKLEMRACTEMGEPSGTLQDVGFIIKAMGCRLETLVLYVPVNGHPLDGGRREKLAFSVVTPTQFVSSWSTVSITVLFSSSTWCSASHPSWQSSDMAINVPLVEFL